MRSSSLVSEPVNPSPDLVNELEDEVLAVAPSSFGTLLKPLSYLFVGADDPDNIVACLLVLFDMVKFPFGVLHCDLDNNLDLPGIDVDIGVEQFNLRGPSCGLERFFDLVLPVQEESTSTATHSSL